MKKLPGSSKSNPTITAHKITEIHSIWHILTCWLICRSFSIYWLTPTLDVQAYFESASLWLSGKIAFQSLPLQHPPGALLLFLLPRLFSSQLEDYKILFAGMMLCFDLWILLRLWQLPQMLQTNHWEVTSKSGFAICLLYILTTFFLGTLPLTTYALAYTALVFAATVAMTHKRTYRAAVLSALAISLYPATFLFVFAYPLLDWPSDATKANYWNLARNFLQFLGTIGLALGGVLLPILYSGYDLPAYLSNQYQLTIRPESFAGNLITLWYKSFSFLFDNNNLSNVNLSQAMQSPLWQSTLLWIQITCMVFATLWTFFRLQRLQSKQESFLQEVLLYLLVLTTITIGCQPICPPQTMLLAVPFMLWAICLNPSKSAALSFYLFIMTSLTGLLVFFYTQELNNQHWMPILLVTGRYMSIIAFLTTCYTPLRRLESLVALSQPIMPVLYPLALVSMLVWMFLANLSETTANDIFIQLRFGGEILDTWKFPTIEHYSATVSGRPFIAHEWLAGVWFEMIHRLFGPAGLSFLAACIALACPIVLHCASPKQLRRSLLYIPILTLCAYLISFRVLVRPHLFTLLVLCFFVYLLESWRSKRQASLLWLWLPVQLVWINLHGAALFGPVFLLCLGLIYAAQANSSLLRSPQLTSQEAWLRSWDLARLGLASACICIINPYGLHIGQFALDLISNTYIKSRIWEWTTPFLPSNLTYYWLWLYVLWTGLIWLSVWLQRHDKPIIDVFVAGLMTYMSLRANRFVPDIAIFGFPIVLRGWQQLRQQWQLIQFDGWQPSIQIVISTLLIANTLIYGYAHSAREHRPKIGWGFGGDMPYQEVALLEKMQLEGIIFNEYSDGSLIIHRLVPKIRPVLDSRIDLYPMEIVTAYDYAYVYPQHFEQFVAKYNVNLALLHKQRSRPEIINYLLQSPNWQHIPTGTQRLLFQYTKPMSTTGKENSKLNP